MSVLCKGWNKYLNKSIQFGIYCSVCFFFLKYVFFFFLFLKCISCTTVFFLSFYLYKILNRSVSRHFVSIYGIYKLYIQSKAYYISDPHIKEIVGREMKQELILKLNAHAFKNTKTSYSLILLYNNLV